MSVPFFQTVKSFAQFLGNWTLKGGQLVDQATADARAAICASCHCNKKTTELGRGCSACSKGANRLLDIVRNPIIKNNKTSSDARLKACDRCGCDLKIKVWIPNNVLSGMDDVNAWPTFCWMKKIEEGKQV